MMVGAHYQEAYSSICHYCTFWCVRRSDLPSKAVRTPRTPKTLRGILQCQQLLSNLHGNVESEPDLTSVKETSVLDTAKAEADIVSVNEAIEVIDTTAKAGREVPGNEAAEDSQDFRRNCQLATPSDAQATEVSLYEKQSQDLLARTGPELVSISFGLLQDHVYRPPAKADGEQKEEVKKEETAAVSPIVEEKQEEAAAAAAPPAPASPAPAQEEKEEAPKVEEAPKPVEAAAQEEQEEEAPAAAPEETKQEEAPAATEKPAAPAEVKEATVKEEAVPVAETTPAEETPAAEPKEEEKSEEVTADAPKPATDDLKEKKADGEGEKVEE